MKCLPRAFVVSHAILVIGGEGEASELEERLLSAEFFDPRKVVPVRGDSLESGLYTPDFLARFHVVIIMPNVAEDEADLLRKCQAAGVPAITYSKDAWPLLARTVSSIEASTGDQCTITHYSPNKIVARVRNRTPGFLILSETYFSGWRAYDKGKETPVLIAFSTLRCVYLTEVGEHEISFVYQPMAYGAGLALSLINVTTIIMILLRHRIGGKRGYSA
jgi:hypothetical protein